MLGGGTVPGPPHAAARGPLANWSGKPHKTPYAHPGADLSVRTGVFVWSGQGSTGRNRSGRRSARRERFLFEKGKTRGGGTAPPGPTQGKKTRFFCETPGCMVRDAKRSTRKMSWTSQAGKRARKIHVADLRRGPPHDGEREEGAYFRRASRVSLMASMLPEPSSSM